MAALDGGVLRKQDVNDLIDVRADGAVTVLCPTDRRRPGNAGDPLRFRHLVDQARERLRKGYVKSVALALMDSLGEAARTVDWDHPLDGIAVFAVDDRAIRYRVPFTVPERVTVDETFATRDLMRGFTRQTRFRVLVLAEKPARLLEGTGSDLHEVESHGFPLVVEGARGEPLASGGYTTHTHQSEEQHRQFFRRVDEALAEATAGDPLPLVVTGVERDVAFFREVTIHAASVVAWLARDQERASPAELAASAVPLIEQALTAQRVAAVRELAEAVGSGHATVGVREVWRQAQEGRGRVLLVEEDFEYPARIVDGELEPAADSAAPGVVDDAVDEIAEDVVRAGGDVVIVGAGDLAEHGPVALVTRY